MNRCRSILAVALLIVGARSSTAQARGPYAIIDAGLAMQPSINSERSGEGLAAGVGIGLPQRDQMAIELRAGLQYFAAPQFIAGPGFCLPTTPCLLPEPTEFRIFPLMADAVFTRDTEAIAPLLLAGIGVRYTDIFHQRDFLQPQFEIGGGLTTRVGSHRLGVDFRYQMSTAHTGLPRWEAPLTLTLRM